MFNVSGHVVDAMGHPVNPAAVLLLQTTGGDIRLIIPASAPTDAAGSFVYHNVPEGTYVLQARTIGDDGAVHGFGFLPFTVSDSQPTDPIVTIHPSSRVASERIVPRIAGPIRIATRV